MALKTVLVACVLVATVSAQYGGYAPAGRYDEYDPNPQYQFAYSVHDASTYDIKSQQESRQGDVVYGNYQLQEPDGSTRTVEYSDTGYGFQATVHKAAGAHPPSYAPSRPIYAAPAPYRRY